MKLLWFTPRPDGLAPFSLGAARRLLTTAIPHYVTGTWAWLTRGAHTEFPEKDIMASKHVQVFNDLNFDQEVVNAQGKVLVDFTAAWCGPCKRLSPIVDEVAEQLEGKIKVGKLDIDEAPMTASKFQVRGVPTLMVFEGGQPVQTSVGLVSKAKVLSLLDES